MSCPSKLTDLLCLCIDSLNAGVLHEIANVSRSITKTISLAGITALPLSSGRYARLDAR